MGRRRRFNEVALFSNSLSLSLFSGRQHGISDDGHIVPHEDSRHSHSQPILGVRHHVQRVQAPAGRQDAGEDILSRRQLRELAQARAQGLLVQDVRRPEGATSLPRVDRRTRQGPESREGSTISGIRRGRGYSQECRIDVKFFLEILTEKSVIFCYNLI